MDGTRYADGLDAAYNSWSGAYYDGDTLYIAGVRGTADLWDGLMTVRNHADWTARYAAAMQELGGTTPKHVVGHSMGGSIATSIGAHFHVPVVSFGAPTGETFAHSTDVVPKVFNSGKKVIVPGQGHSLRGYTRRPPGYRPRDEL